MNKRLQTQTKTAATRAPSFMPARTGLLQRKCDCGGSSGPTGACAECRKGKLQRRAADQSEVSAVPPIVNDVLRAPGQSLDVATRAFMEPRFGHDFSQVRVHTDAKAAESARAVNALAYTVGRHIVFGEQQYAPLSEGGQRLLAHELTHVAQQNGSAWDDSAVSHALNIGPAHDAHEHEADSVAAQMRAPTFSDDGQIGALQLQRAPFDDPFSPQRRRGGSAGPDESAHRGGTLPYREATELLDCIRIMGEQNAASCRQQVLGEAPSQPTHHELPGITTPQPINVQLNPSGATNFQVNGVNVVFNPDANSADQAMANKAETKFDLVYGKINWKEQSGNITSFTGPGAPQVTIRTTYGPGVSRAGSSGYGRGTTAADISAGTTSLGFHEGRHGLDFIEFLQQNPVPQFLGRRETTVAKFKDEITAYHTAMDQYRDQMDRFSKDRTDCVGRTIDQHNLSNGFVTTICQQAPAAGGGGTP